MALEKVVDIFCDSTQELTKVIRYIFSKKQKSIDLNFRREALDWAMEALVQYLIGGRSLPKGFIDKFAMEREVIGANSRLYQNLESINSIGWRAKLAAIHFRGPWLKDGRTTFASTNPDDISAVLNDIGIEGYNEEKDNLKFHKQLLQVYFAIYSRPLTFNEKLLTIASELNKSEVTIRICHLYFNQKEPHSPILKSHCYSAAKPYVEEWVVKVNDKIFDSLTCCFKTDKNIRDEIFKLVFTFKEALKINPQRKILQILKENNLFNELCEAVEMTWHKILAEKSSYNQWKDFLSKLEFTSAISSDNWTPQTRRDLLQGLWFLQGIALYEKLVKKGLSTCTFPIDTTLHDFNNQIFAGFTISLESIENPQTSLLKVIPRISDSLTALMNAALSNYNPDLVTNQTTEAQPRQNNTEQLNNLSELCKELSDYELFQRFNKDIARTFTTPKAQDSIAAILKLCRILCTAMHEQHQLEFQIFIGSASELGRFREIYVFEDNERIEFTFFDINNNLIINKIKIFAKLLKAHYSYLQRQNVGIFLEIEDRINPRVVETIPTGQSIPVFYPLEETLDDDLINRHQIALNTTNNSKVMVARSGGGKVCLYAQGKDLLRWPDNESRGWWMPKEMKPLNSEENLIKIIEFISRNLTREQKLQKSHCELIAKALLWVSEQPGLGCSLVMAEDVERLKKLGIPLNPKKLQWVKSISLSGANKQHIQNTLIQDGATILDFKNLCLEGQQLITPVKDSWPYNPYEDKDRATENFEIRWNYGTRHTSACDLTYVLHKDHVKCYVITVSADGPITVFFKGKALEQEEIEDILQGASSSP